MSTIVQRRLLTTEEAAEFLGVSAITLRKARMDGVRAARIPPPPYIRLGRMIKYSVDDLTEYIAKHREIQGTPV